MKMEEEYNWGLIMKVALPVSAIVAFVFYTNLGNMWKWITLVFGVSSASMIVYTSDKKKSNVFTAGAVVFLVAIMVRFLKNFGFI